MDIVKHIKDFGDGAFDALITAPIAIGDFIARGTGIRDWQLGTGNYYMEQARIESEVLWQAIKNNETRNLVLKELGNEIQEKPFYFLAGFSLGIGVGFGSSSLLKAAGVGGAKLIDAERLAYSVPLSLGIYTAKVHEKVHKLAKENPEMYNLLKDSGVLDTITEDNISSVLDNITSNPLNNFYSNEYKLLSDKLKDLSIATANNLADTANISLYDPIALDLNANGKIDTLSLENGVFFDHNGDKKQIIKSTKKGRDLIKLSPKSLITPDMTALWFEQQKMIEISELRREQFLEEITKEVISEIQRIDKNQEFKILDNENKPKIQCPQCNKGFLTKRKGKYGNFWGCSEFKQGCKAIYPDNKGTPNFETKQASNDTTHKCPQCNKGFLQRIKSKNGNSWWWGCSEFKQGCKAMYYDDNGKPKIINV